MMTLPRGFALVVCIGIAVALTGCNSDDDTTLYQNVTERGSWSAAGLLAFASYGGNARKYVYRCSEAGEDQYLLTTSTVAAFPNNDGGWHPSFSPDGALVAYSARRDGGSTCLYTMITNDGDRTAPTRLTDNGVAGEDYEANWSPDGSTIIFCTTKVIGGAGGDRNIATVPSAGGAAVMVLATAADEQWPCFNPAGTQIVYQYKAAGATRSDLHICNADGTADVALTTASLLPGDATRNEAPYWGTAGGEEWIYFHSNRSGDFDIWRIHPDGSSLQQITDTPQSDGYAVLEPNGDEVLFTRDRELWARSTAAGNTDERRITRRY